MPKCSNCGKSANLFSKLCNDCKVIADAEKARLKVEEQIRLSAEIARLTEEKEQQKRRLIEIKTNKLRKQLDSGQQVFLFESIYLSVDSILPEVEAGSFNIGPLHEMGLLGWQVAQVIPRTFGVALKNHSVGSVMGSTWGAGTGGNVIGVHIIFQKQVTSIDKDNPDDDLIRHITSYLIQ